MRQCIISLNKTGTGTAQHRERRSMFDLCFLHSHPQHCEKSETFETETERLGLLASHQTSRVETV